MQGLLRLIQSRTIALHSLLVEPLNLWSAHILLLLLHLLLLLLHLLLLLLIVHHLLGILSTDLLVHGIVIEIASPLILSRLLTLLLLLTHDIHALLLHYTTAHHVAALSLLLLWLHSSLAHHLSANGISTRVHHSLTDAHSSAGHHLLLTTLLTTHHHVVLELLLGLHLIRVLLLSHLLAHLSHLAHLIRLHRHLTLGHLTLWHHHRDHIPWPALLRLHSLLLLVLLLLHLHHLLLVRLHVHWHSIRSHLLHHSADTAHANNPSRSNALLLVLIRLHGLWPSGSDCRWWHRSRGR